MSVSGLNANASAATGSAASSTTSGTTNATSTAFAQQLGPDAFLKLLTTQLANQDPLSPMDDTQSVAQLAQFSQLQASQNLNSSFTTFAQNFGITQSSAILGKTVTVNDPSGNGGTLSGTVSGVAIMNGSPTFNVKDSSGNVVTSGSSNVNFDLSQILSIQS